MKVQALVLATLATASLFVSGVEAQSPSNWGVPAPQTFSQQAYPVQPQFQLPYLTHFEQPNLGQPGIGQPGINFPAVQPGHSVMPLPYPNPTPRYRLPQHPEIVTPNQIIGRNPFGVINTGNRQIDNTYFDPARNLSANNGTKRYVNRPVYDANGQIVGYEKGYVWNNSVTGVEHGELKSVTDNGQGGVHEQIRSMSVPIK
jgi:hypothetical protein